MAGLAVCIVGNSSSGIRESAFLGVPCVNIGSRQAGRERGRNVVDVGYDRERIEAEICRQVERGPYEPNHLYGDGKSGSKIVEVLKDFEFSLQKRIAY